MRLPRGCDVRKWRSRFASARADGLLDKGRPGAPRKIDDARIEEIVRQPLETTPKGACFRQRSAADDPDSGNGIRRIRVRRVHGPLRQPIHDPHRDARRFRWNLGTRDASRRHLLLKHAVDRRSGWRHPAFDGSRKDCEGDARRSLGAWNPDRRSARIRASGTLRLTRFWNALPLHRRASRASRGAGSTDSNPSPFPTLMESRNAMTLDIPVLRCR